MDWTNISLIAVAALNFILAILILARNPKSKINIFYSLATFGVALWGFSEAMLFISGNVSAVGFWAGMAYTFGAFIALSFLLFSFHFPFEGRAISRGLVAPLVILFIVILGVVWLVPLVSDNAVNSVRNNFSAGLTPSIIYLIYFFGFFIWSYINLIKKYKDTEGFARTQMKVVMIGVLIPLAISATTNLIIPIRSGTLVGWVGPVSTLVLVLVVSQLLFFSGKRIKIS